MLNFSDFILIEQRKIDLNQIEILKNLTSDKGKQPALGYELSKAVEMIKDDKVKDLCKNIQKIGKVDKASCLRIVRNKKYTTVEAFVAIMAWGGWRFFTQDAAQKRVWESMNSWLPILDNLRNKSISPSSGYSLLHKKIPQVGPAYFTKILFFFDTSKSCYIMDQFTGKAMHILTRQTQIPKMLKGKQASIDQNAPASDYEAFCEFVNELVPVLGKRSPVEIEELIFSQKNAPWRVHTNTQWKELTATPPQKSAPPAPVFKKGELSRTQAVEKVRMIVGDAKLREIIKNPDWNDFIDEIEQGEDVLEMIQAYF